MGPDGLWKAAIGDGVVLKKLIQFQWFKVLFIPGYVYILDRGFRDAEGKLKEKEFFVIMPQFSKIKGKQLSTEAADKSRDCKL